MSIVTTQQKHGNLLGSTPWGNLNALHFILKTGANGGALEADSNAPLAVGDKVRLGIIPAGSTLVDALAVVSTGLTATVKGDLGFEYVDGVDAAKAPQDAAYFGAALDLAAAARLRNTSTKAPVTLPKDAYLVLTTSGAANAKAARVDVVLQVISTGAL
ncbi:hypothetical protein N5D77_25375 [Comamonas thiooxydans]|uniref:Uncharacterized protein n=1 Tax=Comamonas thiooxydans TaxID=363952 RepID=A0AA42Q5D4_9BURK|nr:hypothetical protein [Comamonas thiooxydans]MDH1337420.1 hypothetical protein [Comamonas thiooxydans]MDH1743523.1 hypothetical protein [Comamonas thiooxydans]MDH1789897.1 hypothetical protein [Comamonas thiooxydans]